MNFVSTSRRALLALGLLATIGCSAAAAHDYTVGKIQVVHPTITPTIGVSKVNAGHMTIRNSGTTPDRLISASSPGVRAIEIHTHTMKDGVMRMGPVEGGVVIAASSKVEFRPGGLHLMIFDPAKPVLEGDLLPATLVFERAGSVEVQLKAERRADPKPSADHSHH